MSFCLQSSFDVSIASNSFACSVDPWNSFACEILFLHTPEFLHTWPEGESATQQQHEFQTTLPLGTSENGSTQEEREKLCTVAKRCVLVE